MGFRFQLSSEHSADQAPSTVNSLPALKNWMKHRINRYDKRFTQDKTHSFAVPTGGDAIAGYLYVAPSIEYDADQGGLVQTGSSPSYFGGLWTLACCKKRMRGMNRGPDYDFKELFTEANGSGVLYPKKPIFILTCASSAEAKGHPPTATERRNWLASVAMVTHGFYRMEDYGQFLRDNFESPQVNRRLTGVSTTPEAEQAVAKRKGDCHIDDHGNVVAPPAVHDHGSESDSTTCECDAEPGKAPEEYSDNRTDHIKLLSEPEYWMAWDTPEFATVKYRLFQTNYSLQSYADVESRLLSVHL